MSISVSGTGMKPRQAKNELIFNRPFRLALDVVAQPGMSPDLPVSLLAGVFSTALQSSNIL